MEDLEERLNDALHQKQLLGLRLDGQLKLTQEENRYMAEREGGEHGRSQPSENTWHLSPVRCLIITRKQQSLHKQEMEAAVARQQQLEAISRRLGQSAAEVRRSIRDLDLSRDKYQELRDLPDEELSVQEHVAVSLMGVSRGDPCEGNLRGYVSVLRPPCLDAFVRGGGSSPGPGSRAQREEGQSDRGAGR